LFCHSEEGTETEDFRKRRKVKYLELQELRQANERNLHTEEVHSVFSLCVIVNIIKYETDRTSIMYGRNKAYKQNFD
jgi:hypothetical protein